jgi:drug/metabolite transporter (DMT)-like permease
MLFAALTSVLFGLKGLFVKLAYSFGASLTQTIVVRFGLLLPVNVGLAYRWYEAEKWRRVRFAISLNSLLFAVAVTGDFYALQALPLGLERVVFSVYATLVVGWSMWRFKQVQMTVLLGLLITYCGIGFLFGISDLSITSYPATSWISVAIAAVCYAAFIVRSQAVTKLVSPHFYSMAAQFFAGVFLLLIFGIPAIFNSYLPGFALFPQNEAFLAIVGLALFSTLLPFYFLQVAIKRVGSVATTITTLVSPVVALLAGVLFLGEVPTASQLVGICFVLSGIGIALIGGLPSGAVKAMIKRVAARLF